LSALVGLEEMREEVARLCSNKQSKSANIAPPMFQHLAKEPFTSKIEQKHGEKEERHQRHNLTVLSRLPVARSGAVG
jgi:hypothetical protein